MKALKGKKRSATAGQALGVTVHIGVFFDGTGNNRVNSQIGADCQAMMETYNNVHIKECAGRHSDPDSSYSNDMTNIAKLAQLYRHQPLATNDGSGLKVHHAIYVSGVGTTSGGRDSLSGQGFGRGNTGVVAKVGHGVRKIADILRAFETHNPRCVISRIEFDLFGFSRGAASARHMANEILKQRRGALGELLTPSKLALSVDFSWKNGSVRLNVIGLFDTVAAVGGLRDLGNVRDAINKRVNLFLPPGCARQVLHLVAADENRRNFALNSIKPHWTKEIVLPGSHSDIGGGYQANAIENVALTRPLRCFVSASTANETTDAWLESKAQLDSLDPRRWLDPRDPDARVYVACSEIIGQISGVKRVEACVKMQRRVFGYLSRVYLRVMHALACDEGVPFEAISKSGSGGYADLSLPPELRGICDKLIANARGQGEDLTEQELQVLYQRYIHRSAHWNGLLGARVKVIDSLFFHAPASGGRQEFPNESLPGYPE